MSLSYHGPDHYLGATPSFHRLLCRQSPCHPWAPFGDALGTPSGPLGEPVGTPWGSLRIPWGPLGTPWGSPGDPRAHLGDTWGSLGKHLGILLNIFVLLGHLLGILWGQLGPPRGSHRVPKGPREASWGPLGSILEASKAFTKRFSAICKNLQICCKVLQNSRSGVTEPV